MYTLTKNSDGQCITGCERVGQEGGANISHAGIRPSIRLCQWSEGVVETGGAP